MKKSLKFLQSIHFKIPLLITIILLIAFQFVGVFFINQLETQSVKNFKEQLITQTELLISNTAPVLANAELRNEEIAQQLQNALATFATVNKSNVPNIQIINTKDGIVASNVPSEQNLASTNRTSDADVREALVNQKTSEAEQFLSGQNRIYKLVKPIISQDTNQVVGAIKIEANMNRVYEQKAEVMGLYFQSALIASVGCFVLAFVVSQGLTRPIEEIRQQSVRIAEGVYNFPAKIYGNDELGDLATALNELSIKVKESQESTESERQRLDGVLRHMTDGVIATDRRGYVLLVNDRAMQLLNLNQNDAIGNSILKLLHIDQSHTLKDLLTEDNEVLIQRQEDGQDYILKGEFSVIRRETGFITGMVCVLTDVTEQEKTEKERREFVSNVSHELRTPLTSMKSYTEALIDGAWRDEMVAPKFLSVLQSESDRMMRMIGNLLDLSKIDGGQIVLDTEYIDFKRLIHHILDRFEFTLKNDSQSKKYRLVRHITSRDLYLEIDQDRITQVIDNIMNNAIKYSPDGGVITVTVAESHNRIILSVRDQGLGIPQKDIPHLFERFYRVDKARSREQGGTGLGLAISKEVVEMHKGKIWVESEEEQGSTFFVELPYDNLDYDDEGWDMS